MSSLARPIAPIVRTLNLLIEFSMLIEYVVSGLLTEARVLTGLTSALELGKVGDETFDNLI
jgi:hypothetical protein